MLGVLRLLLHYLKDGTVHILRLIIPATPRKLLSKAYPSNLLRPQYDILSDLIPELPNRVVVSRSGDVGGTQRDLLCSV